MSSKSYDQKIRKFIDKCLPLQTLWKILPEEQSWLVGGTLRDLLLERCPDDIDIACDYDPTEVARKWARTIAGNWFWLDKDRQQSRVITPQGEIYDFSPLRAASITDDLSLRDYTVNALAYPLLDGGQNREARLLDPLGGIEDLNKRILRQCHEHSFDDDPLRMLKGIRHSVCLGFTFSYEALADVQTKHALIDKVAGERIQAELEAILMNEHIEKGVDLLIQSGLISSLFYVVVSDDLRKTLPASVAAYAAYVKRYLEADAVGMILAFLFKQLGILNAKQLSQQRLRLSKKRQVMISQVLNMEALVVKGVFDDSFNPRQKALFYERLQPCAFEKLIHFDYAKKLFTGETINDLKAAYSTLQHFNKIPHLLSGHEILQSLTSAQGQAVGALQEAIKAAEITGKIRTREDAVKWLEEQNID